MSEADSAICKKKRNGEWSNMPYDLLSNIANRLELIDFTSFTHVCKDTCGTLYDAKNLVWGQYIRSVTLFEHRLLKGVWILPRYHKH
ncbi:hypothetical protein MtrunA17_Chr2g0283601 [Medicago truncatula]|uniref:F-box domain-containing protein n=1 Tax=Medicago truncatula TaxID=3880 RepID=G7IKC3_MEDTR|nr:hypothetical protein MTR_2g015750 [Medicago truncatula]RHN72064.1 hypothetical protein MtrunA17_Chr2g0283601 [Medicago truncatula]